METLSNFAKSKVDSALSASVMFRHLELTIRDRSADVRLLNSIIIGLTLIAAPAMNAAARQTTSVSTDRIVTHNSQADRYCPSKAERGSSCPGGKKDPCTPLMRAAERGQLKKDRSLLASGADVNAALGYGGTALMLAASEGHLEIVKALLAAGANANSVGGTFHYGGFVAWMSALNRCNKNWAEIFDAMLASGVELNPTIDVYFSPLGYAISKQQDPAMIDALVKRGANVNIKDLEGETPLMFAARFSSAEVVKTLIDLGADVNAKNKRGESVLAIAEMNRENIWQRDIVRLLTNVGAKR